MITLPKVSNLPRWLVLVSLTLNLVLIAVVGAHLLFRHGPPPDPVRMVAEIAEALPQADGERLRLALKSEGLSSDRRSFDPGAVLDQARAALQAEPFDPAALNAVLSKGLSDRDTVDQAILHAVVLAATTMSPDGRHRLAALHCLPASHPPKE